MSYTGVSGLGSFGLRGFGLDVPFATPAGTTAVATVGTGPNCGDPRGMQAMLHMLGFYQGQNHGQIDELTQGALVAYGLSKGIVYNPSSPPSGEICAALMADYEAYTARPPGAGSPTECAEGQWGMPPLCFGEPKQEPPTSAGTCPSGTVGIPPYCVGVPSSAPPTAPGAASCPAGTIGVPPNCFAVPAAPGQLPTTPPGEPPAAPGGRPPPPTQPGAPPAPPATASFWSKRSDTEKLVIVAAAGLGVLLVAGLIFGKKKPRAALTPNRRRRRPRRRFRRNLKAAPKRRRAKRTKRGRRRYPKGKLILLKKSKTGRKLKKGKRWGRETPAKKYRRKGIVRRSQYAWPAGYMYPVATAKYCRAAASRFGQNKKRYPMNVRRTIAKNINKCKKRFGIGGPPIKP